MAVTKDKMAAHSKKGKTEKNKFTLKPNQNLEFRVWLHMTPILVKKNAIDEKTVTLTEDLIVSFDDKGVQSYPMTCLIHYPILELPQKLIDFGVCFVGQRRELMLKITNSSKALLYWKIAIDKTCSQTARDVFKLDTSTFCHSNKTNSFIEAEHSDEVIIQFLAKHNIEYECRVIVTSIFHELFLKSKGSVITVCGQGSYDEGTRE